MVGVEDNDAPQPTGKQPKTAGETNNHYERVILESAQQATDDRQSTLRTYSIAINLVQFSIKYENMGLADLSPYNECIDRT